MKLPFVHVSPVLRSNTLEGRAVLRNTTAKGGLVLSSATAEGGRITHHASHRHRSQGGSAVIVVIGLLAIIMVYIAGNIRTLTNLGRELTLLERKQTQRLQAKTWEAHPAPAPSAMTNAVPPVDQK